MLNFYHKTIRKINNLIYFILIFSGSSSLSAQHYDYIYKKDSLSFYQSNTTEEFLQKKRQAYQQVILTDLAPIAVAYATYWAYQRLPQAPTQPNKQEVHLGAHLGGAIFFLSTLISGLLQNTLTPYTTELQEPISGFIHSFRNYVFGPANSILEMLELEYITRKENLGSRTRQILESLFIKLRTTYVPSQFGLSAGKEDSDFRMIRQILALPLNSKPIEYNVTHFNDIFSAYEHMTSDNPVPELKRFCDSMALASRHENPRLKSALYLQGPPGVGKTEAAKKLALVLEIPLIKINLAELSQIGQIKGIRCEFAEDNRCTPGIIASELIANSKSGYRHKNALLLFDEADQVLNRIHEGQSHELVSFMLDLLEGRTQYLENPYFGTGIDIRHFGIILAGNQNLTNKALNTRLNELSFGNYTQEYRIKAGREQFLPEILKDYADILELEDFDKQDLEAIDNFARLEHQKLVKDGEDPGFRSQIRELERFVHKKAQER